MGKSTNSVRHIWENQPMSARQMRDPSLINKTMFVLPSHVRDEHRLESVMLAMRTIANRMGGRIRKQGREMTSVDSLFCLLSDNGPQHTSFGLLKAEVGTEYFGWLRDDQVQGEVEPLPSGASPPMTAVPPEAEGLE